MQIGDAIVVQKQLNEIEDLGASGRWFGFFIFAIIMAVFYLAFTSFLGYILANGGFNDVPEKISEGLLCLAIVKTVF